MTLAVPGALLLLAALLPAILVLHTLRREEHPTASLFLWRRVVSRRQGTRSRRSVPWRSPLLWLHLAIATLAVVALAGPRLSDLPRVDHVVLVLDASRTMRTADVAPSRFGAAVDWAQATWLRPDVAPSVSLVLVGHEARVLAARQPAGPDLAQRLSAARSEDAAPAWQEALAVASRLTRPNERTHVVVLTDGATDASLDAALQPPYAGSDLEVERVIFGGPFVNVGVAEVQVLPRSTTAGRWTVSGELRSVGLQRGDVVRVQVLFRPLGADTSLPWSGMDVEVGRGGVAEFEVPIDLPGDGVLEVRTGGLDQLPSDDVARRVLRSGAGTTRVALVGDEDPAIVAALRAVGGVEIFLFEDVPEPEVARTFDLAIVTRPSDLPVATSVLWFGAPPSPFVSQEAVQVASPIAATPGHPLMRDVEPEEIGIRSSRGLRVPTGAQPLITEDGTVLAWSRTTDVGRQVAVGFGSNESAWASQVSFPVFVASMVAWARSTPPSDVAGCTVGTPCALPAEAFAGGWSVVDDAAGDAADAVVARALPLVDADDRYAASVWPAGAFERAFLPIRAGLYELRVPDAPSTWIAVDAPALAQSDLPAQDEAVADAARPSDVATPFRAWRWIAALTAILLAVDAVYVLHSLRTSLSARSRAGRRALVWGVTLLGTATAFGLLSATLVPSLRLPAAATTVVLAPAEADDEGSRGSSWWDRTRNRVLGWATVDVVVDVVSEEASGSGRAIELGGLDDALDLAPALTHADGAVVVDARDVPGTALPARAAADLLRSSAVQAASLTLWPGPDAHPESTVASEPILALEVPVAPRAGGAFDVVATLEPQASTTIVVATDASGAVIGSVVVPEGSDVATLTLQAGEPGWSAYTLRLRRGEAADASVLADAPFVVNVLAPLEILFVTSDDETGALLATALEAQQIRLTRAEPARLPANLDRMATYDSVVLVDVQASEIHPFHQDLLQRFVRDAGGGLVITGGIRSFGPGGYYSTLLDDVSPLSSRIEEDAPEVAMTFVLDRSGSMDAPEGDATRLDLAKLATFEAIRLLGEKSQAALVAFDTVATTLLPLRTTAVLDPFRTALQSVVAGGGTSIYPALAEVYSVVAASDAATRHVIVLTDGLSEEADFAEILGRIRALGVDTSFVGIGDAASRGQLTRLAGLGGGSLHFTSDARALPGILAQEALLLSADPIEEGVTVSRWERGPPDFLGAAAPEVPPTFLGYVETTPKDEATVHLTDRVSGDPLLATWRYGLGRVAAFTTEADGPWSGDWTRQDDFATFWSQLTRWSALTVPSGTVRMEIATRPGVADVVVDVAPDQAVAFPPVARLVHATRGTEVGSVLLELDAPGRWSTRLALPEPDGDTYVVQVVGVPGSSAETPVEQAFVNAATAWSAAPGVEVVAQQDVADALARATRRSSGGHSFADGRLGFALPRFGWYGSPRDWLVIVLVAFAASLAIRFGGVSRRGEPRALGPRKG